MDILKNIELTIAIKTPTFEQRIIFVRPEKIRALWGEDQGLLGEMLRDFVAKRWGEE